MTTKKTTLKEAIVIRALLAGKEVKIGGNTYKFFQEGEPVPTALYPNMVASMDAIFVKFAKGKKAPHFQLYGDRISDLFDLEKSANVWEKKAIKKNFEKTKSKFLNQEVSHNGQAVNGI